MAGLSTREPGREHRFDLARSRFFDEGLCPEEGVKPLILRSWQRCRTAGLQHGSKAATDSVGRAKLSEARERSAYLLEQASGVMEHVFEQIRASGSMVILSDPSGLIVHSLGDADFVDRANRVTLQPGACWSENDRGTNAIGTAIRERACVEVLGREHYLEHNGFLSCTAAPVFGAKGELSGIFDISADHRAYQRHTLGLVRLSVQLLEKRLFEMEFASQILIAFHSRPEYVGSLQEAMVAVSPEGCIVGANTTARDWLARRATDGEGATIADLFRQGLGALLDRAAAESNALIKVDLRQGGELYLQVRSLRPLMVPAAGAEAPPRVARTNDEPVRAGTGSVGHKVTLECLATGDPAIERALDRARRIQGKDIPLLIQGESGVGKELFAQAFHNSGPRAHAPFVALNCAAVPESLIESELFGYVGGAFTGARREGAIGKIQQAHGGTLFLDEIGDMPLGMQARLLRVLQERCVTPVGSSKSIAVDISLVCATHRVLRDAVARGEFREDLYYRVNSLTVSVPPLRERSDIRGIVDCILETEARDAGLEGVFIGDELMQFIERYAWPGNVRQLQNVLRVAVALLDGDEREIRAAHLSEDLFVADPADSEVKRGSAGVELPDPASVFSASVGAGGRRLDQLEVEAIEKVMREVGGNLSAAARYLGVSRNRLYRKLGRLN